jgi:hypothetical protein
MFILVQIHVLLIKTRIGTTSVYALLFLLDGCEIFKWLGLSMVMPVDLITMLQNLISGIGKGRGNKGIVLIWYVVMWSIWLARNELIFSNKKKMWTNW